MYPTDRINRVENNRNILKLYRPCKAFINSYDEMCVSFPESSVLLKKRYDFCVDACKKIESAIFNLTDLRCALCLSKHYLEYKSLERIGLELNYAKRSIERFNVKGLEMINFD